MSEEKLQTAASYNPVPQRVADAYRALIIDGEIPAGSNMPTRREMIKKHGISRESIDRVVRLLESEGYVEPAGRNQPYRVVDVSDQGSTLHARVASVSATGEALGKGEMSHIVRVEWIECPPDIAMFFGFDAGTPVLVRERVGYRKGMPIGMSSSYYSKETVDVTPELKKPVSMRQGSRELAAERLGSPQDVCDSWIISRVGTAHEMRTLKIGSTGNPVPVSQELRVVRLVDGRIVEVATKITDGRKPLKFRISLKPSDSQ